MRGGAPAGAVWNGKGTKQGTERTRGEGVDQGMAQAAHYAIYKCTKDSGASHTHTHTHTHALARESSGGSQRRRSTIQNSSRARTFSLPHTYRPHEDRRPWPLRCRNAGARAVDTGTTAARQFKRAHADRAPREGGKDRQRGSARAEAKCFHSRLNFSAKTGIRSSRSCASRDEIRPPSARAPLACFPPPRRRVCRTWRRCCWRVTKRRGKGLALPRRAPRLLLTS